MPNVAAVLREEISRLARKEVAAVTGRQAEQIKQLKTAVRGLKAEVATLQRELARVSKVTSVQLAQEQQPAEAPEDVRISPTSIRKHRERLRLTQADMARLVGVSTNSINLWEKGKTKPQGDNRVAIAKLRGLGVREAAALLETMG